MGGARRFVRGLQTVLPPRPQGLRILCYHLVGGGTDSVVDLPRKDFEAQLAALRKATVVGLGAGLQQVQGGDATASAVLTFDDAFRNFREVAWPLLEAHQLPATLFVPTGFVDGTAGSPLTGVELSPCDWSDLRAMATSPLLTIGSHTCTHTDLRRVDEPRLESELRDSRAHLEDRLGVAVGSFCYPRALWDRRVETAVARVYDLAVVGGGRRIMPGTVRPHRLWRTSVRRDAPLPVAQWLAAPVWLEEALADTVRRRR
jgi:peptidoglycan/xylan/chitin deacetylase (PgdA/CDA1 family)